MNVCIAYFSKFGNGRICTEYLGEKLREAGHDAVVSSTIERKPTGLPKADLHVFSSPTRMGRASGKMLRYLKRVRNANPEDQYVVMGTYGAEGAKTLEMLEAVLEQKGWKKAQDGVLLKVVDLRDPLDEEYKSKLDEFSKSISAS